MSKNTSEGRVDASDRFIKRAVPEQVQEIAATAGDPVNVHSLSVSRSASSRKASPEDQREPRKPTSNVWPVAGNHASGLRRGTPHRDQAIDALADPLHARCPH